MAEYAPILKDVWFCGEDKVFQFTIHQVDSLGVKSPLVEDISGWSLKWEFRQDEQDEDALLTKTTAAGSINIPTGTDGICRVAVDATDTSQMDEIRGAHALMRVDTKAILSFGEAMLTQAATR